MNKEKVLIAGGGLAGICIAYQLLKNKVPFLIVDKGINLSSSIAAGLINPIVFRRMLKSWRVDDFLPYAINFYANTGELINDIFLHFLPLRRGFAHLQEAESWESKQYTPEYSDYLSIISEDDKTNNSILNNFGSGIVKQSGYVNTAAFLEKSISLFKSLDSYLQKEYAYSDFNLEKNTFQNTKYEKIIFCEGFHGLGNPWFNHLPLQATKGQTLTIKSLEIDHTEILNRKCFILPIGENKFKVGATYEWNDIDPSITDQGLKSLEQDINQLIDKKYEIIDQEAGIRPTVKDRRPLLGQHPLHKDVYIFNGLGTKGYLMAPLLALELYQFIFEEKELDREIDIKRFK
jgi:glycine oxidase